MIESRHKRPPLATIICIYMIVTAFIPVQLMWILLWGWFHSILNNLSIPPLMPRTPISLMICALAVAGAIALWLMHRSAFFLLAIRPILSLLLFLIRLPHALAFFHRMSATSRSVAASAIRLSLASIILEWLLNILIVWYVYRITAPQRFYPEPVAPELTT